MSGSAHGTTTESNEEPLPNQSFVSWLKSQTALFYSQFIGLAGVLYLLAALIYYLKYLSPSADPPIKPGDIQKFVIYAHIPFLLLFIVSLLNMLDYNFVGSGRSGFVYYRIFNKELSETQLEEGKVRLKRFKIYFLWFWVSMLVLYLSFIFQINYQSAYELTDKKTIIENIKEANQTPNSLEAMSKILQVKKLLEDKKTKEIISKLQKGEKSLNFVAATEEIKEIEDSNIVAKINILHAKFNGVINEVKTIDSSESMLNTINQFPKINEPSELESHIENIKQIPIFVGKIQKINDSDKIVLLSNKIQEINYSKARLINEERLEINSKIQNANKLINEREKVSSSVWGAIYEKKFEFFVFASNNISLLFIFWCFSVLAVPWHLKKNIRKEKRLRINGTLVILLFTFICYPLFLLLNSEKGIYYEDNLVRYTILTDAVSGLINAVVIALLIARLDSKLIGLHSALISVLYGYSAVQSLFAVFEQPGLDSQIIKAFVLIAVFIFKVYFFLIITYTLQTGRMLDYLVCFPTLARRVDSIFANQFEFVLKEGKKVEFSIRKKNKLIYSSHLEFEDVEECRKKIEDYKKIMRQELYYLPKESSGTYWVDVLDDKKRKICYSIPLKSKDEAEDLINESIENIPFCKVG